MNKGFMFYLKLLITALFIAYIVIRVDFSEIFTTMLHADRLFLAGYFVLGVVTTGISAFKWKLLCAPFKMDVPLRRLFSLYFVGYFYNNFMPSNVGGDVFRAMMLADMTQSGSARAFATVFLERFTGVTVLLLSVLLVVPFDARFYQNELIVVVTLLFAAAYGFGTLLVFSTEMVKQVRRRIPFNIVQKVCDKAERFQTAIFCYRDARATIIHSLIVSALFYAAAIVVTGVGLLTFNQHFQWYDLALAVPVMMMLFMLPITIGGIGLQEWAYGFVLSLLGVPLTVGVSLGLLFRFRGLIFSLVGGILNFCLIQQRAVRRTL